MNRRFIVKEQIEEYSKWLKEQERSEGTIEKYLRDIRCFAAWVGREAVTREKVIAWKDLLQEKGYAPVTVNSMLAAVNAFFRFAGWDNCRVKALRIQRRVFREQERELTREEYLRLLQTARNQNKERLALVLESICATGIRVSEVRYLTVAAVKCGRAQVALKGKIRVILIPDRLQRKLLKYAKKQKITSGEIFITRGRKSLSRKQIWAEMKWLCSRAGVEEKKVFPHNLRHLFARSFYKVCQDITKLADILGHSSIETTRIYLMTTGTDHLRQMSRLHLIC